MNICSPYKAGTYSLGDGWTSRHCADVAECPCLAVPGPCFTVSVFDYLGFEREGVVACYCYMIL